MASAENPVSASTEQRLVNLVVARALGQPHADLLAEAVALSPAADLVAEARSSVGEPLISLDG